MFRKTFYNWLIAGSVLVLLTTIASADINDQVAQLDIDNAHLDDVIRIFGEPVEYSWGSQIYERDDLPVENYCVCYPNMFCIHMRFDWVMELRFNSPATGYVWTAGIHIGSSLNDVLDVLPPAGTVIGQPNGWQDGVLYKDINGTTGYCYYHRADQNVRLFFTDYKVSCLYVTRSDFNTFQPPEVITSVEPYDDVRCKDMSQLDLSDRPDLPATLWFNLDTIWPAPDKMPAGCDPNIIMTNAMNPGLGVRALHQQGITGAGVNVAIIDQPMYLDHPEFAGKIVAYYDTTGSGPDSSMHGPSVTSLLVGENCGTAPEARVYYVAAPSWLRDAAYYADGLDWIIAQNEALHASEKIRVVSVSAAPSGENSPFLYNNVMWDETCARAEATGILIIDCSDERGLTNRGWYDPNDPENVVKFTAAVPGYPPSGSSEGIYLPVSRTMAEESFEGDFSYHYTCRGGLSWTVPYCAGVLAMGWQVQPELSKEQMVDLLFQTAYLNPDGAQIINPPAFIDLLLENKPAIQLSNDAFEFYADSNGPNPETQILSISNSGLGTLNWVIEETCDWLQVSPDSGVSTGVNDINEITLSITEINLGVHTCKLTISDPCAINNPQFVSITLYVSDPNAQTIQDAIDAAEDGDIVIIDPGIYTGEGNRDLDFKGKAITVRSINPDDPDVVASTVIDCQGTESEPHRGFYFHNNEDTSSVLNGLTITGGYESFGGAIMCDGSSPMIMNCIFVENAAGSGGGARNITSNAVFLNCTFTNNSAFCGGGMQNEDNADTFLIECTFNGNSATLFGGGIRNYTSSPRLDYCLFTRNTAGAGGAIQNEDSSSNPSLTNCTLADNTASTSGGGIVNASLNPLPSPALRNCILWGNADEGGADQSAQIHSGAPIVNYSCIQGWTGDLGGIGNTGANPLFADPEIGDYHLKSEAGRWNLVNESWIVDNVTSPCIDTGNPSDPVSDEPEPNGGRINMGAYGGTNEASKSPTN